MTEAPPPDLHALTSELTRALSLPVAPTSFAARAQSIEHLDAHVLERLELLAASRPLPAALKSIASQALELRERLEAASARLVSRLAARIAAGRFTREGLARAFARLADARETEPGYDALDELLAELLDPGELAEPSAQLEPEMVAYQPTPGRVILTLVERAALSSQDVLCDLGSGLGWVVIVASLLSGARGVGVELEPAYCAHADASATRLGLSNVSFIAADARAVPLPAANVFYLYTPFRGQLLADMLERLRQEAQARPIRVCTYGPCSPVVARAPWLRLRSPAVADADSLCLFESRG